MTVPYAVSCMDISTIRRDSTSTVSINPSSWRASLSVGINNIVVTCLAEDLIHSSSYTLSITRLPGGSFEVNKNKNEKLKEKKR